jgi:hypothetical protein
MEKGEEKIKNSNAESIDEGQGKRSRHRRNKKITLKV